MACVPSAGHHNRWVSTESGVTLEAGQAGGCTPESSWHDWEACTFRYLGVIAGNTKTWTEQEEGSDAMAVFKVASKPAGTSQETGHPPQEGRVWQAQMDSLSFSLKGTWVWILIWLPAACSYFSVCSPRVSLLERGTFFCAHLMGLSPAACFPRTVKRTIAADVRAVSLCPSIRVPSQIQCWVKRWVLLSPGLKHRMDFPIEKTFAKLKILINNVLCMFQDSLQASVGTGLPTIPPHQWQNENMTGKMKSGCKMKIWIAIVP